MTERGGKPLVCAPTAGQRHEATRAIPLPERATERLWPEAVAGDKGYGGADLRNRPAQREIEAVVPSRKDGTGPRACDRALSRERPPIERTINRLKRFRRGATRFEKRAATYLAMVTIAMILEWPWLCRHALAR